MIEDEERIATALFELTLADYTTSPTFVPFMQYRLAKNGLDYWPVFSPHIGFEPGKVWT